MASHGTRPRRGLHHIGGLMPSFSTYMKFAVTLPSSPFGPARNTAAPGFSRLLSAGTGARIGTSGPMLYSDSPSLNLTCTILPCGASVTVPTVALVITLSEPRSHADCRPPSGCACEKIRTSIACSLPSVPLTPAEARKSPALISARDFLTRLWILVASVTATFTSIPSRALTVRFAPSTFSIVPRTRTGGAAGGFCASAGSAKSMAMAAATADLRSIPPSLFFGAPTGATAAGICPARQLAQLKLKGEWFDDSSIRRDLSCPLLRQFLDLALDDIGRIDVPTTPQHAHGADPVETVPSPSSASTTARFMATGSDCRPTTSPRSN